MKSKIKVDLGKQYPNTFVKFKLVKSHIEENKEIVDDFCTK